jgi:phage tail tape-measure protein
VIDTLDKSKVTGIPQVDNLQDGVNNLVAGQVGQGGLLQPVGDAMSKEGINRAERQGKDDKGSYGGPAAAVTDPIANNAKAGAEGVASSVQGAGSYVGGFFGGGKKEQK